MAEETIFVRLVIRNQKVRNEKGAAVVEFAIILPLLLLLIFAIIEFGLLWYNKAMVTNAAREGARAGLVFRIDSTGEYNPVTEPEISAAVDRYLANHLVTFGAPLTYTLVPPSTRCPQDIGLPTREVIVTVQFFYTFLTIPNLTSLISGGSGSGFPLSVDLTGQSVMTCE